MLFQLALMTLMLNAIEHDLRILGEELKSTNHNLNKLVISLMNSLNSVQKLVNEHKNITTRNKTK